MVMTNGISKGEKDIRHARVAYIHKRVNYGESWRESVLNYESDRVRLALEMLENMLKKMSCNFSFTKLVSKMCIN